MSATMKMEEIGHRWEDVVRLSLVDHVAQSVVGYVDEGFATQKEALIAGFIASRAQVASLEKRLLYGMKNCKSRDDSFKAES